MSKSAACRVTGRRPSDQHEEGASVVASRRTPGSSSATSQTGRGIDNANQRGERPERCLGHRFPSPPTWRSPHTVRLVRAPTSDVNITPRPVNKPMLEPDCSDSLPIVPSSMWTVRPICRSVMVPQSVGQRPNQHSQQTAKHDCYAGVPRHIDEQPAAQCVINPATRSGTRFDFDVARAILDRAATWCCRPRSSGRLIDDDSPVDEALDFGWVEVHLGENCSGVAP